MLVWKVLKPMLLLSYNLVINIGDNKEQSGEHVHKEGVTEEISGDDVLVAISLGKLRGKRRSGPIQNVGDDLFPLVDWFLGVPYASPPIQNLRFQKTKPARPWVGTRDATKFQPTCPQRFLGNTFENEDCLYINIYAPVKPRNSTLSTVMLYIHGGSYLEGSGNLYIGDTLAQHGVVAVTMNYRLGILGFLSSRTNELRGNWGLYDQIESLNWIKSNIKFFGGDPNKVTIFGNSAGGASVGILSTSSLTKGLVHRAIMQSGSPLSFWAVHSNMSINFEDYVRNLAGKCGCKKTRLEEVIECLRSLAVEKFDIRTLQGEGLETLKPTNHDLLPILDDDVISYKYFQSPFQFHVDSFMSGVAANEWSRHIFLYFELYAEEYGLSPSSAENLCCDLDMKKFQENVKYVMKNLHGYGDLAVELVIHRYTNHSALNDMEEIRQQYMNFAADLAFVVPTINFAGSAMEHIPTYFYVFNHKKFSNQYKIWQQNYHEIELTYIFGHPFRGDDPYSDSFVDYSPEDKRVSLQIMKLWTNFAKFGNPNDKERSRNETRKWLTFDNKKLNYYVVDLPENSSMKSHLRSEYVAFWNNIIPLLGQGHKDNLKIDCLNIAVVSVLLCLLSCSLIGVGIIFFLKKFKFFKTIDHKNELVAANRNSS